MPFRCFVVYNAKTKIQTPALKPCSAPPSGEAVPHACDELFKEANHHASIVRVGVVETVTNGSDLSDKEKTQEVGSMPDLSWVSRPR
jgi:hypothetical protein